MSDEYDHDDEEGWPVVPSERAKAALNRAAISDMDAFSAFIATTTRTNAPCGRGLCRVRGRDLCPNITVVRAGAAGGGRPFVDADEVLLAVEIATAGAVVTDRITSPSCTPRRVEQAAS